MLQTRALPYRYFSDWAIMIANVVVTDWPWLFMLDPIAAKKRSSDPWQTRVKSIISASTWTGGYRWEKLCSFSNKSKPKASFLQHWINRQHKHLASVEATNFSKAPFTSLRASPPGGISIFTPKSLAIQGSHWKYQDSCNHSFVRVSWCFLMVDHMKPNWTSMHCRKQWSVRPVE